MHVFLTTLPVAMETVHLVIVHAMDTIKGYIVRLVLRVLMVRVPSVWKDISFKTANVFIFPMICC